MLDVERGMLDVHADVFCLCEITESLLCIAIALKIVASE